MPRPPIFDPRLPKAQLWCGGQAFGVDCRDLYYRHIEQKANVIGQTISHYRILEKLGGGGMGVVYKAQDLKLDRPVALKFLPPESTRDPEAKTRFIHEAKAASALQHSNICVVYDIDETSEGELFICMEHLDGETLKQRIANGQLSIDNCVDYATQVAQGLAKAHESGIIHRDIKPANVMLTADGVAKIVDFGLAKLSGRTVLTKSGSTVGTAAYMSPEQARGETVDARTDIWSLGVVLYEMLTGNRPFESDYEQALVYSILNEPPKPITSVKVEIPQQVEKIVLKALEKKPENRYQNVEEMIIDLASAAGTEGTVRGGGIRSRVRRKQILAWGAFLVVAAIATIVLLTPKTREVHKLAILPFLDTSRDSTLEFLYDGLTEDVIKGVSRTAKTLKVLSFNGVAKYKNKDVDPPEVGRELGVDAVAICRVNHQGNDHDFRFEIVAADENTQVWSEAYKASSSDLASLPDKMSAAIVKALGLVGGANASASRGQPVQNLDAWRLYQKGNSLYHRLTEPNLRLAIQYFKRVLEIEPNYALAHAGIALSYCQLAGPLPARLIRDSSLSEAIKALELDNTLPEAHLAIGFIKYLNMELQGAAQEIQQAIELNPSYADAIHLYAHWYAEQRQFDKGLEMMHRSIELEPLNPHFQNCLGLTYYEARRWDEGIAAFKKVAEVDSTFPPTLTYRWLAPCYRGKRDYQNASNYYKRVTASRIVPELSKEHSALAIDLCEGRPDSARNRLTGMLASWRKSGGDPFPIAWSYAMLKEKEQTLKWVIRLYEDRSYNFTFVNAFEDFDFLRGDPRFEAVMKKAGYRD
ncbi:MAG: protein kinase [Ignavibacteria bacterium]|nr:protein kinase [Ignavibacteria bacterium]